MILFSVSAVGCQKFPRRNYPIGVVRRDNVHMSTHRCRCYRQRSLGYNLNLWKWRMTTITSLSSRLSSERLRSAVTVWHVSQSSTVVANTLRTVVLSSRMSMVMVVSLERLSSPDNGVHDAPHNVVHDALCGERLRVECYTRQGVNAQ